MNSEAIKLLTPLLPIRPVVNLLVGPFLPVVFRVQFGYCYSYCPSLMPVEEAKANAERMRERHREDSERAWVEAEARGVRIEGVDNKHEDSKVEALNRGAATERLLKALS